ncbi:MAG: Stp1/IreP family PP2C-type Ser/Thr phosphatase [Pyrinomonadaceae bacterium]
MKKTRELKPADLPSKTIAVSVQTDVGCVREANEDNARHVSPNDAEMQLRKGTLTIVADGMGGHASGEIASQMAIELISEIYYASDNGSGKADAAEALRNAIEAASREIYETSLTDEKYFGMGTTLVALVVFDDRAIAAHVGDSRIYRLRGQELEMLTLDHSQVMEMVKHGVISMEEARSHDDKNVILRAVGTQPQVEVEVSEPFAVQAGDAFLLCSDGLSDMLSDAEIRETWLAAEADIYAAAEQLINEAKKRGGHDNITVGIVKISFPDDAKASRRRARVTREVEV